ncbi:MAG: hypothetical protein RJB10_785, partial [Pseudomonadota bacterium]
TLPAELQPPPKQTETRCFVVPIEERKKLDPTMLDSISTGILALDGDLRVTALNAAGQVTGSANRYNGSIDAISSKPAAAVSVLPKRSANAPTPVALSA